MAGTPHLVGCIRPNIQLQQGLYRIRVTTLRVVHEGRVLGLNTNTDAQSNMSDTTLCVCVFVTWVRHSRFAPCLASSRSVSARRTLPASWNRAVLPCCVQLLRGEVKE